MFWKKTKQSPISTDVSVIETPNYPAEVVEIHTEFHEASDKLLAEAQAILNCTKRPDDAKVNLLKSLGFNQAQEVTDYQVVIDKISTVPDPVVLFPIENNMYVIVTAWGNEASDENVVNHQMN